MGMMNSDRIRMGTREKFITNVKGGRQISTIFAKVSINLSNGNFIYV
ncbi:MAG: hypothetical protein ACI4AA_00705 [Lachnospiraceae bacterium]